MSKIWNDKHASKDFAYDPKNDIGDGMLPVNKLTDMFHFEMKSETEINERENIRLREEYEKAMKEHEEYNFDKPEDLPKSAWKEVKEYREVHDNRVKQFYNCIYGLSTVDSLPTDQDKHRDTQ